MTHFTCAPRLWLISILSTMLLVGTAQAEQLSGAALVKDLHAGGYVILMRHASSPATPPAKENAEPENRKLERQLDQNGRSSAQAMGTAIRALGIPVGQTLSSPTYRAQETVRLAALPNAMIAAELGDGGQSMQPVSKEQTIWLRAKLAEAPRAGTNTIIVTQYPNIMDVFGQNASGLTDGEALVIHPDGAGAEDIVGWVKIADWPALASQQ